MSTPQMDDLKTLHRLWQACNYLSAGMIYLRDNPLLSEPLKPEHIKKRLLGHWGSSPGLSFMYLHMCRLIRTHSVDAIFMAGPGHGAPGVIGPVYLEGTYSEVYPDISQDAVGMLKLFRQFSFPGGIGSHCTPELPGSIHEGGELGYSLSHAFGAAFDNPDLIVTVAVGDGEAETGPLATAWHSAKFLNPIRDGAVLPILHLNGYKINNPTLLSRIPDTELASLFEGYGWKPHLVEGSDPQDMHRLMAAAMDECLTEIRTLQAEARHSGEAMRKHWPMIVLRSPKGWTGPGVVDGNPVAGTWRSHQVPLKNVRYNPEHLAQLEYWLRSYEPETLFDASGRLVDELREWLPQGATRMSASAHANGGMLKQDLVLPPFRDYAMPLNAHGRQYSRNTWPLGEMLRDTMRKNTNNFRVFGPDETSSNKLDALYEATSKLWLCNYRPEDEQGGHLSPDGRVLEMLSEHTLQGWYEGYVLSGRHGFFATYEAFVHVIDSMINQHAKWLAIARELSWRKPVAAINLLITSTVWRQDHNGFTHQDPGFLDLVVNKSPEVTRIYLPPDANTLLAVADHCLRSEDKINVIVCDKQSHLQYLPMDEAVTHCEQGLGVWSWASSDQDSEPDVVIVGCGDVPTKEALAATVILRSELPELKVRFINVVDLFCLASPWMHPHGLDDDAFDALFTCDKPVIFNFHAYPWLIHRLAYKRTNHHNMHVRGYTEHGNINTPLELAIINGIDRFSLVCDVLARVPGLNTRLGDRAANLGQWARDEQQACLAYAHAEGVDRNDIEQWSWKGSK